MYKVLVANRDEYDTKGIEWLLNSSMTAWQIQTSFESKDMINKIERFQPDLLIIELDMIEDNNTGDFFKAVQIIQPAVIALTMEATFSQAKKAIDIGVADLLLKPISPEILLKTAQKCYRKSQLKNNTSVLNLHPEQNQKYQYQQLFLENENESASIITIGIKAENQKELPGLYTYLENYTFKHSVQPFILSGMIILIGSHTEFSWKEEASRFMRDWQEISKEPIAISINSEEARDSSVRQQYLFAKQLMELTFYVGFQQIIEDSSTAIWRFVDPFLTPEEQRIWVDFLNQSDIEGIKSWLYNEFLQYEEPYPEPGLIRIRLTSILAQIRRHMKTFKLSEDRFEKEYLQLFQSILYAPVIYRIIKEVILFVSSIFEAIKTDKGLKHDLVERVLHYMKINYWDSNLTLEKAAEHAERNPSYISSLLSKKCGKTFRELLNDIRIQHAVKLLIETDMTIKEISSVCGFSNQQYFNKVFNKIKHLPPNQYRKSKHESPN